jgi:hypothetical protein
MFTELAHFPQFPQPDNDWHERAAIMEFDGGISRPLAEALAVLEICPAGIEASRWQHTIDELARLLNPDYYRSQ